MASSYNVATLVPYQADFGNIGSRIISVTPEVASAWLDQHHYPPTAQKETTLG